MKDFSEHIAQLSTFKRALLQKLLLEKSAGAVAKAIPRRPDTPEAVLSYGQQRLWFLDQLAPNSAFYNMHAGLHLSGQLDLAALSRSFTHLIGRHESLRTVFRLSDGQPLQLILPAAQCPLPLLDLSALPPHVRQQEVTRLAQQQARRPFDLSTGPLLRLLLLRLAEDEHVLLLTMHHIISDGWSMGVLVREVMALYEAELGGTTAELAPLPIQYADYAHWQREWLTGERLGEQLSYWREQLAGAPQLLDLPTDHARPAVQSYRGATHSFVLDEELSRKLKALSRREGVTLFMVLLGAYGVLLSRYSGAEEVVVGTPVAGRTRMETEGLIGFFVNTLALRVKVQGERSFREVLEGVRRVALGGYEHQELPFEKLVEELQPERDLSRNPLFQTVMVLQNTLMPKLELPSLMLNIAVTEVQTAKFDLTLKVEELPDVLRCHMEYNSDLFEETTIERMAAHFRNLMRSIVAAPERPIARLEMLSRTEHEQLLRAWNEGNKRQPGELKERSAAASHKDEWQGEHPRRESLQTLFEAQVEHTPGRIALVCQGEELTYLELNRRANQIANHLQRLGIGPEARVGLLMERSMQMLAALLGIIKAGAAYVPLDPLYPQQRLAFMLGDAQVRVVLTESHLREKLAEHQAQVVYLDADARLIARESEDNPAVATLADSLAYIIYTSGSTGQPKGVMVTHGNVARLFAQTNAWFNFTESDVWTFFHSYAFDFSVWEIWGALLYGGKLVVVPYLTGRSPEAFYELLSAQQVTILNQTPSAFRQLIRTEEAVSDVKQLALRLIVFGGEALELQSLRPWIERHGDEQPQLINMYGITETTVHVTHQRITRAEVEAGRGSLIGRPIPDLQIYLLDAYLQPAPIGVSGEIHVGGAGLARGYLNHPELTAERFIPDPFDGVGGARLYRTGDLARRLTDGNIEYMGRRDEQVKVRGFRIELGEIEAALNLHPGVRSSIVLARGDERGDKQLIAYLVWNEAVPVTAGELRQHLNQSLPEYMIPQAFVQIPVIPLTANGKLDKDALPPPESSRPEIGQPFVAPQTEAEKCLARIWSEVLGLERVGIHDNFFELGGDSIRSIRVLAQAREQGYDISLQQLFQHQTVYELTRELDGACLAVPSPISAQGRFVSLISPEDRLKLPSDVEDAYQLAALQLGMIFHNKAYPGSAFYHDIFSINLRAPFDFEKVKMAVARLIARHPVLRTSFDLSNYSTPLQLIWKTAPALVEMEDWRHLSAEEQERALRAWIEEEKQRGFDWATPPLLRFQLHHRSQESFQLTFSFYHAILDGWSVATLLTELFHDYLSSAASPPSPSFPAPLASFRDYVALERETIESEEARRFWSEQLKGSTFNSLPRLSSGVESPTADHGHVVEVPLSDDVSTGLKRLASSAGLPLKSVLLAAHMRVMSLLCGQRDILTGLITNGRLETVGGERVLGLFLNTLPFRLKLAGGTLARPLARDIQSRTGDASFQALSDGPNAKGAGWPATLRDGL